MTKRFFIPLAYILFCLPPARAALANNAAYIRDVEGLLNSVGTRDSSRPQLTLKLADAFINEALTLSSEPTPSAQTIARTKTARRRAVQLYQDSLTGLKGQFRKPSGNARGKIQFQLARLYADLGENQTAESIWKDLASEVSMPEVQRESALRLAEVLENRGGAGELKEAEGYYKRALTLCSNQDVCSYIHYRLAWVFQRQEHAKDAIQEMNQALWDSKGQIREEALRDLIGFLGGQPDDGKDSLDQIEKLSGKLKRPVLIGELSGSYFSHGNRHAGVYILDVVNRKSPSLKSYVRLMEEDYGFRDWDKFATDIDGAMDLHDKGDAGDLDSEKILRRLTVQLDGERVSSPKSIAHFKKAVMLYLALYPTRNERGQMIDGWIAATSESAEKIDQLKIWIAEDVQAKRQAEEVRLRKIRASLAQTSRDLKVVIEEMTALQTFTQTSAQTREGLYQIGFAHYQNEDSAKALPIFVELALLPKSGAPDKWSIQSEHLALDILANKKDFAAVQKQAHLWTADPRYAGWVRDTQEHWEELAAIRKVETSARFEAATQLGNKPEALTVFAEDCEANVLLPQSCANAKVLAVKLGDQKTLIAILKKLGKKDELAAELEASAEFSEAATLLERNLAGHPVSTRDTLKVALLYELGGSKVNRDRLLHALVTHLMASKSLGAEEDLILKTLQDAELLQPALLKLAWSKTSRDYLVDLFASHNQGGPALQTTLVKSCTDTGPGWRAAAFAELSKLDTKQRQIHFAGKGSKHKFEMRVAGLKALSERGNCYLQNTSAEVRAVMASMMAKSERDLAAEIKATPIPDEVDAEGKASLEKALLEMAQPFVEKGEEFTKLAAAQMEKIEDVSARDALKQKLANNDFSLGFTSVKTAKSSQPQSADVLNAAIRELHQNPNQKSSLTHLKAYYEASGNTRLAAYFQGRLLQLGEETTQ